MKRMSERTKQNDVSILYSCYVVGKKNEQLSIFRHARKIAKSDYYLRCVRLSVSPSARTTRLLLNTFSRYVMFEYFRKSIELSLKSNQNNGYFTWTTVYTSDHISLSSMRIIADKTCSKNQNTHFMSNKR
jgi:hypothetical protein